jgi:aspartate 1-decarboxylase
MSAGLSQRAFHHYIRAEQGEAFARNFAWSTRIMRQLMRSKLHNGRVTDANVVYIGSIEIDVDLLEAVGLWVGERVLVVSNTTGARLETYTIAGKRGSRMISMNGAAAKTIGAGEQIIVMGFEFSDKPVTPRVVLLDDENNIVRRLGKEDNDEARRDA